MRLRLLPLLLLLAGRMAWAVPLESTVVVETEEDLYELLETQEIDESTFSSLIELFRQKVDLDTASREDLYSLPHLTLDDADAILRYRHAAGGIGEPTALVAAGVLAQDKLLAIAAFLVVSERVVPAYATDGWVRYQTAYTASDKDVPPMALQTRVDTLRHLRLGGAAVLTRRRLGEVSYDASRNGLQAAAPAVYPHLSKVYARWETSDYVLLAGTYRIGFGQRLTFDTTDRYSPNGLQIDDTIYRSADLVRACIESTGTLDASPCAGDARYRYVGPDFRWSEGLRGVAGGWKELAVGKGFLQIYGFGSYQRRSIYQYEIYNRAQCSDPRLDDEDSCAAPKLLLNQPDPAPAFSYMTLPDLYDELLYGGNATFFWDRRAHLGVTAYGARIDWRIDELDLDFQEWSRRPYGGPFGAVGMDASWGRDWLDLSAEVARSFDSMPAGGGHGAIVRATSTGHKRELELILRYYDRHFANPYAGSQAAPDETDGRSQQDEIGGRVRATAAFDRRLSVRGTVDSWYTPSDEAYKLSVAGRGDVNVTDALSAGLWAEFHDKDLAKAGRGECFESTSEEDAEGEPIPCAGEKIRTGARVRYEPLRNAWMSAQLQHTFIDEGSSRYMDAMRQDVSAIVTATYKPRDRLRLRTRLRYLSEGIDNDDYLEESMRFYVALDWWQLHGHALRVRYDANVRLDERESTQGRTPNPEHSLRLELEGGF